MFKLLPGIKRHAFRDNDPRSVQADAVFAAKRPVALQRASFTCQACGYRSAQTPKKNTHLQVHHKDDQHHNNEDENLAPICFMCHGYPHLGCNTASTGGGGGGGITSKAHLAAIPELSAPDLNNLLRAIGLAMRDPAERETAQTIYEILCSRVTSVAQAYGASAAADFAAAMARMSDEEYVNRGDAVQDLRLIFRMPVLERAAKEMAEDHPTLRPSSWAAAFGGIVDEAQAQALGAA